MAKETNATNANKNTLLNPSNVITAEVRFSYVRLFEPVPNQSGVMKYSACLLLDKENAAEKKRWDAMIEAAIKKGIEDGKFTANQRPILKLPIRDGDKELATEQKKGEEYKGMWFVNASANHTNRNGEVQPPPEVTKPQGGVAVPILNPSEFYSGCHGRAIITFYAFNEGGSKGIAVAINGAYKTKDGDRLDGRVSAVSAFADLAAADSAEYTETETDNETAFE